MSSAFYGDADASAIAEQAVQRLSSSELLALSPFNHDDVIGQGGFAAVYAGAMMAPDGAALATRRRYRASCEALKAVNLKLALPLLAEWKAFEVAGGDAAAVAEVDGIVTAPTRKRSRLFAAANKFS